MSRQMYSLISLLHKCTVNLLNKHHISICTFKGEEEKTGLWNVVADILNRTDDVGSIKVKVKDVKEAYQQQRQLENELMQLNSTISERNSLLAEKEQTIENLNR